MQQNKKILVAGGTGFIGRRAVNRLIKNGYKCHILTRQNIENTNNIKYIQYDLRNDSSELIDLLDDYYDAIVYLAANIPLLGQKKETYQDAKKSTLDPLVNFCQAVMSKTSRFVYASSIDVVGIPPTENYDENVRVEPATPYALAKYCGEFYVNLIAKQYNVKTAILRFSQVYGPNEPLVRVIPILLKAIRTKTEFNKFTTGEEKRRFLFVEDAVFSVVKAIENKETSGIFNIAGGSINTINELIETAEKIYEHKLEINIKANNIAPSNVPDISKAESVLGYKPEYTLSKGLEKIREVESKC